MTQELATKWYVLARKNQNMARIAEQHGEWLFTAFHLQQSLEKALKGIYLLCCQQQPPYIHDLPRLAAMCQAYWPDILRLDKIFTGLTPYYISSRYPEYKESVSKALTKERLDEFFSATEEVLQWFEQSLK